MRLAMHENRDTRRLGSGDGNYRDCGGVAVHYKSIEPALPI